MRMETTGEQDDPSIRGQAEIHAGTPSVTLRKMGRVGPELLNIDPLLWDAVVRHNPSGAARCARHDTGRSPEQPPLIPFRSTQLARGRPQEAQIVEHPTIDFHEQGQTQPTRQPRQKRMPRHFSHIEHIEWPVAMEPPQAPRTLDEKGPLPLPIKSPPAHPGMLDSAPRLPP